ncbi:MAG: DUF1552 domain-containing protein [Labilithrix sp.]|nr:DUF1552 domain-containing protein [Labilithrix sp.]
MAFSRRKFLIGIGGAVVGLPFLEGLAPKTAKGADPPAQSFALFYRRGNGVQQGIFTKDDYLPAYQQNQEVERWWPMQSATTPISFGNLATFGPISALNELEAYVSKTTVIKNLRHPYGTENGHPEGFIQGLSGAGVLYVNNQPSFTQCSPLGETLDNRLARELTPLAPQSLYMGAKTSNVSGVSWFKSGGTLFPRSAQENLLSIYNELFLPLAADQAARELLISRRKSVNDLVRDDLESLKNDPRLSGADRDRLAVHFDGIRDMEVALTNCVVPGDLENHVKTYNNNSIIQKVDVIGRLAALAIACGARRSVLINVGTPQDIVTYDEVPGAGAYEFHALSHRQANEQNTNPFAAARDLHHAIDRFHLKRFKSILDRLSAYDMGGGKTLLDLGVSVHYSDIGSGQHIVTRLPYLYVGGVDGRLVTGKYVDADAEYFHKGYLVRFLNNIGAALGLKNAAGNGPLDDFNADNNNYRTDLYCNHYYDVPWPGNPTAGKPPITGRYAALIGNE